MDGIRCGLDMGGLGIGGSRCGLDMGGLGIGGSRCGLDMEVWLAIAMALK